MMETATEIKSKAFNEDCLPAMKQYADKHFDLACVDVPYGIGVNQMNMGSRRTVRPDERTWDNEPPTQEYWQELFRISKHQIIWGANHFISRIPFDSSCWVVWDKGETMYGRDFAECELAWTSYDKPAKMYKYNPNQLDRIHPTQKPVKLYDRIYRDFLPEGGRVLDSHLGSGSNRIAAHRAGNIEFVSFEIDREYFEAQEKRFRNFISQQTLNL